MEHIKRGDQAGGRTIGVRVYGIQVCIGCGRSEAVARVDAGESAADSGGRHFEVVLDRDGAADADLEAVRVMAVEAAVGRDMDADNGAACVDCQCSEAALVHPVCRVHAYPVVERPRAFVGKPSGEGKVAHVGEGRPTSWDRHSETCMLFRRPK